MATLTLQNSFMICFFWFFICSRMVAGKYSENKCEFQKYIMLTFLNLGQICEDQRLPSGHECDNKTHVYHYDKKDIAKYCGITEFDFDEPKIGVHNGSTVRNATKGT